jgi:hypothetical protein
MPNRHELEDLIRGIDEELGDCRRDWKEADCTGDDEVKRQIDEHVAITDNFARHSIPLARPSTHDPGRFVPARQ